MTDLLAGKVAIVTGAAHPQGIGRAIFDAMHAHGAEAVGADLPEAAGLADIDGIGCDITVAEQCEALVAATVERFGRVDILVNNAGVGVGSGDFMEIQASEWDLTLQVNLMGQVNMCKAAIPRLLDEGGSIINVASLSGLGALDSIPACYTASKFASVGLSKQLAMQYANNGIRVNALCPGSVVTQMHQQSMALLAEAHDISLEEAQALEDSHIALGRSAQPAEIGSCAVYLASDLASYVTGTAMPVAGGMLPGL